jgi:hypothetical protein
MVKPAREKKTVPTASRTSAAKGPLQGLTFMPQIVGGSAGCGRLHLRPGSSRVSSPFAPTEQERPTLPVDARRKPFYEQK